MKHIVLYFPDTSSLADFIITNKIRNAQVSTQDQSLSAVLSEELIELASTQYGAVNPHKLLITDYSD